MRQNRKIIGLIFSFSTAGTSDSRSIGIGVGDNNGITAKSYSITNGDAGANYVETPIANPQGRKGWEAKTGSVTITNLTATSATVSVSSLSLMPIATADNTATGTITVSGSGTATFN